jgi:hypothetical protein
MKISGFKSWVLCFVVMATVSHVTPQTIRAQEKSGAIDTQKETEKEQRQELEKKTLALLNEVASSAWSLKLPENRLFIISNAADLLWTFDEKRARTLSWDALNSLNAITPAVRNSSENLSKAEQDKVMQAYFTAFGLRQRLLRQIARRDGQLALDMLRATRQVPPKAVKEFPLPDDRQLEQEIASVVVARDPGQALQVARQSLAKGLTWQLMNLLDQLNEKDSEKASQFAGEIITKLQGVNVATDFHASVIGVELLEISRAPDKQRPNGVEGPKVLNLNDEQKRQLVEILTNAALTVSANSHLLRRIPDVMPEIQQFFPERRAGIERKLAAFNETLTKQQREQNTYNELVRRGTAEELVRSAATADDETKRWLYHEAAMVAIIRGNPDSFRDFLSKEIDDTSERNKILDSLDDEEITGAVFRKRIGDLRKLLPKIGRKEERARAMAELALMLKEKGEDAEASSLLDDAATLIKTDMTDDKKTNALLTLLCAYAIVDPPKAFSLAEQTIDRANSQISMLMLLDRVVKSGAVKKSEILLEQRGMLPLDSMIFRYGKGVAALGKADFNRTRALADRFDRSELRLMAQLLIVKGILQPQTPQPQISNEEHR